MHGSMFSGRHRSTKKFGPFSACFRQPLAESHCRLLHGYGLVFKIEFAATTLDANNWVIDFGSLKPLKALMEEVFDHKLVVAADDPCMDDFDALEEAGIAKLIVLPAVGCEAFAEHVFWMAVEWLEQNDHSDRVRVSRVEVWEHDINSAIFVGDE